MSCDLFGSVKPICQGCDKEALASERVSKPMRSTAPLRLVYTVTVYAEAVKAVFALSRYKLLYSIDPS